MRKGIIVGGMILSLLMGCNNGIAELEKEKESILSISNLRKGFLDVFATFGGMVSDVLGIKAETKKSDVGEELGKVGKAVETVKDKLEEIKGDEQFKLITNKADGVITKAIETLGKIVNGASKIKVATKDASGKIGNAAGDGETAAPANDKSVQGIVEGISIILEAAKDVDVALKGEAVKSNGGNFQAVGKLFGQQSDVSDGSELKAANGALNAASGADILTAIKAAKDGTGKSANQIQNAKDAYDIAIANTTSPNNISGNVNTNASAIAAGLALRAMAQSGKLATKTTQAPHKEINSVLIGAVDKTINEIISTIRRTVDKCLKNVSDCIKENSSSEVKSK